MPRPALRRVLPALAACLASVAGAQVAVAPGTILDGPAGDGRWHWIEVEPARSSATGWVTITGAADVKMSGTRFHADLRPDQREGSTGLTLDGRISGARVRATEVLLNTDADPMLVRGIIRRTRFGGGTTEERIVFRGGQAGDASYLGLARSVRRPS